MNKKNMIRQYSNVQEVVNKFNVEEIIQLLEQMKTAIEQDDVRKIDRLTYKIVDMSDEANSLVRNFDVLASLTLYYCDEVAHKA
nr:MAG TPA: hypothetical protein [Caudoviricetes sp.]